MAEQTPDVQGKASDKDIRSEKVGWRDTGLTMNSARDYGDLMQFLLYFREQYSDDDEFNTFVMQSLRSFVYDLRDLGVYISISPQSLKWSSPSVTESVFAE